MGLYVYTNEEKHVNFVPIHKILIFVLRRACDDLDRCTHLVLKL